MPVPPIILSSCDVVAGITNRDRCTDVTSLHVCFILVHDTPSSIIPDLISSRNICLRHTLRSLSSHATWIRARRQRPIPLSPSHPSRAARARISQPHRPLGMLLLLRALPIKLTSDTTRRRELVAGPYFVCLAHATSSADVTVVLLPASPSSHNRACFAAEASGDDTILADVIRSSRIFPVVVHSISALLLLFSPTKAPQQLSIVVIVGFEAHRKIQDVSTLGRHLQSHAEPSRRLIIRDDKAIASKYIADYIISMPNQRVFT
jgi:hypothetical protein